MFKNNRMSALLAAVLISVSATAALVTAPAIAADPAPASAAASAPVATPAPAADAATPAAATPTPPPGATDKETVDNPYGLDALWKGGDFVARGVLILLVLMSMGSWYIIVTKFIDQMRVMKQAREARNSFWKAGSVHAGMNSLPAGSAYRMIAENGVRSAEQHGGAMEAKVDTNTWILMALQRPVDKVQSRLSDGLAFLATVGSTAPFIGLFGTVWGIYHALTAIGIAGQASIDKVAGPVGEALIMTAIGLAVAVPAVLGYNWLVRRNKAVMEDVRGFSADLHGALLSGVIPGTHHTQTASVKKVG
jgi:biopolymer transport protein ExbB